MYGGGCGALMGVVYNSRNNKCVSALFQMHQAFVCAPHFTEIRQVFAQECEAVVFIESVVQVFDIVFTDRSLHVDV